MAIYQGADTMKASRAQSLWDVIQGKKRHDKRTLDQFGNRQLFSQGSNILEYFLPQGLKQLFDVGSKQLEQKLFEMPEYEEPDGQFWGSKFITKYEEDDKALRSNLDTSLLESIIGSVGDYIGDEDRKDFDLEKFMSTGRGGDVAEAGGLFSSEGFGTMLGFMKNGGQVPQYYGGGSVSGDSPTIAGYFSQQGKTLGGSNTQSLAEKLGRK